MFGKIADRKFIFERVSFFFQGQKNNIFFLEDSLEGAICEYVRGVSENLQRGRGSEDEDPCPPRSVLVVPRIAEEESFACVGK